jgi:hypothetical protein
MTRAVSVSTDPTARFGGSSADLPSRFSTHFGIFVGLDDLTFNVSLK